jgi:hypothetical protein
MTQLIQTYLQAMQAAESLETKICILAKYQLSLDHKAYQEVFGAPVWSRVPPNLQFSINRESGEIVLTNGDFPFGAFPLQIESLTESHSRVYAAMVQKYALLKEQQDQGRLRALESDQEALRTAWAASGGYEPSTSFQDIDTVFTPIS